MSAIECRDGEDVHEGEHDGDEGGHRPETEPIPLGREEATNGNEATNL